MESNNYPDIFKYRESHWEGSHTSYSWQDSQFDGRIAAKIVGETKCFYLVELYGRITKMKKENIIF